MKPYSLKSPCECCPYRKDAPPGIWDAAEFIKLKQIDESSMGSVYGCHLKNGQLCAGWLADQKRRGTPSILLRVRLGANPLALKLYEKINEKDPNLLTLDAMLRKNLRRLRFPNKHPKAQKLVKKLEKKP